MLSRAVTPATTVLATQGPAPNAAPSASAPTPVATSASASSVPNVVALPAAEVPDAGVLGDGGGSDVDDTVPVRINIWPEGTRLYLKGRPVGRAPFTLRVPRGTKHVYEAVLPGYAPRRVIIDGSKKVIDVSLKREESDNDQPGPASE